MRCALIGEHGRYPRNELGQTMYPRKEFFDQIVAVIERSKRPVPVFNDKHLSYRWDWAKAMYDDARRLKIPFMAGSSVPLAERRPPIEFPQDAVVEEAVSIHGGGIESYDFHAMEVMQSLIEARRGGETGVSQVQLLTGDACRGARKRAAGRSELVNAAMNAEKNGRHEAAADDALSRGAVHSSARGARDVQRRHARHGNDRRQRRRPLEFCLPRCKARRSRWRPLFTAGRGATGICSAPSAARLLTSSRPARRLIPSSERCSVSGILDAAMHSNDDGGKADQHARAGILVRAAGLPAPSAKRAKAGR